MVVAKGKKIGSLYTIQANLIKQYINAIDDSSINLWHMRLGHLSDKELETLARKNLLPLKEKKLKECSHYLIGKQHRFSFHNSFPHIKSNVLDLVHADICCMDARILGGASYFVTSIDDCSRKV